MRRTTQLCAALLVLVLALVPALADESDKPFAEAHIVLQLADGDAESQSIDECSRNCKQRAEPEQLHQSWIVLP